ncbi:hypothetical protein L914_21701 [Phytophthora nicotianae]|uniref:Uncharacterized protein n=1 Tax=Phytophthora nicotianae TaxID=4792 RepID=W2M4U6_PHYNI|nr:hypothetical protein L914_21701 [Phytophthora nicotianae]
MVVSECLARLLLRKASSDNYSAAQPIVECGSKRSACTIPRILARVDWMIYSKMKISLALIVAHKLHCLEWSKGTVDTPPSERDLIIFPTRKK